MVTTLTLLNKQSLAGHWTCPIELSKLYISNFAICIKDVSEEDASLLINDLMQHDIRSERSRDIEGNNIFKIFLHPFIECKFV